VLFRSPVALEVHPAPAPDSEHSETDPVDPVEDLQLAD